MSRLLYDCPAKEWEEALPIGNGRMGAMIYGGAANEHIQLNEDGQLKSAILHAYSDIDTEVLIPSGIHKGRRHIECRAGNSISLI